MQGILGGAGLDGGILADVIDELLAVHSVERFLRLDGHLVERGGYGHQLDDVQVGVVLHGEGDVPRGVVEAPYAEDASALRDTVDFEIAVAVGGRTLDEGGVLGVEHGDVGVCQRGAGDGVAQKAYHLERRTFTHLLFLLHLGSLLRVLALVPAVAVAAHRRSARVSAAGGSSAGIATARRLRQHTQRRQQQHYRQSERST